jgi:molybdate transport system substrate-binding protein
VIAIPDKFNVIAEYPAGKLAASQHKDEASAFLAYLKGEQGRATLAKYGFALP